MPQSLSVYYEREEFDLKREIARLTSDPRSPYYQRSTSTAAKLLLQQALEGQARKVRECDVIPTGIEYFNMELGDHIILMTFSGTRRYVGTLLHLAVAALTNPSSSEFVLLFLPPELDGAQVGGRDDSDGSRARFQPHNYGDNLRLYSWEESRRFWSFYQADGVEQIAPWDVSRLLDESELQSLKVCDGVRVISAISSGVMVEDPEYFLNWEEHLRDIYYRRTSGSPLASLPVAVLCTYQWQDFLRLKDRMPLEEAVSRAKNCHEKIIVLTEDDDLLTGLEASDYVIRMVHKAQTTGWPRGSDCIPKEGGQSKRA